MKKYLVLLVLLTLFAVQGKSGGPYTISGLTTVSPNQSTGYGISPADGTTYSWSVTNGTIVSGQGTPGIVVQWAIPTNGNGQVSCSVDGGGDNIVIIWPTGS